MNEIKRNYQKELEQILGRPEETGKRLLLHSCCAPCSSYCMEYLCRYFRLTVFYYNPNISPREEYEKRVSELKRLIACYNDEMARGIRQGYPIEVIEGKYEPEKFYEIAKGLEDVPEGGERCFRCFKLRLSQAAKEAASLSADYFTTTLTISPLKNAAKLNEIGEAEGKECGIPWLPSDFKKKNGYKRSIELSGEYDLYRQNFCGCVFSRREAEEREKRAEEKEDT